ncbi:MAG: DHA2 family efflux MFS transporter permease subunit [Chitinophagaceae bacterium]|nr:MAG: DHA2 family efflux MFS transporter permease subunit [Chitinophagaceae bacterium]
MATLDSSIVNIALPTIRRSLAAGDNVEWIVLSYLIVTTSTLLIMGRLSDMYGRKVIYILGFTVFVLGSLLCALSWDIWSLVSFRVVQGLGASMMFAIGPAIVSDAFQPNERGKALGLMGTVVAAGSSTGPVAGGLLLEHFGWTSIFYVNIPIGLIAIWRAFRLLPATSVTHRQKFDLKGAALFFLGVTSLLIGVDLGAEDIYPWDGIIVISLVVTGIILLVSFLFWEKIATAPMLKLSLFRIKPLSISLLTAGLGFIANGANIFVIPFYLQMILDLSPKDAGLVMLAGPLTLSIAAPVGGYLSDKISTRWIASTGLLITGTGYMLLSMLQSDWSSGDVVWRLAMLSLGFGLFQSPNSSSALNAAPASERGIASSLVAFMRNLGLVFGIALGAAVWYTFRNSYAASNNIDALSKTAQVEGMQMAYRVVSCLVFLAATLSVLRGETRVNNPSQPAKV